MAEAHAAAEASAADHAEAALVEDREAEALAAIITIIITDIITAAGFSLDRAITCRASADL